MRRDSGGISAATQLEQACLKDLEEAAQRLETLENDLIKSGASTPCQEKVENFQNNFREI